MSVDTFLFENPGILRVDKQNMRGLLQIAGKRGKDFFTRKWKKMAAVNKKGHFLFALFNASETLGQKTPTDKFSAINFAHIHWL